MLTVHCSKNNLAAVKLLLEKGADPNFLTSQSSSQSAPKTTPLIEGAAAGNPALVKILLDYGNFYFFLKNQDYKVVGINSNEFRRKN